MSEGVHWVPPFPARGVHVALVVLDSGDVGPLGHLLWVEEGDNGSVDASIDGSIAPPQEHSRGYAIVLDVLVPFIVFLGELIDGTKEKNFFVSDTKEKFFLLMIQKKKKC